jgi:hypothetical protein
LRTALRVARPSIGIVYHDAARGVHACTYYVSEHEDDDWLKGFYILECALVQVRLAYSSLGQKMGHLELPRMVTSTGNVFRVL